MRKTNRQLSAFTLIELLVVISIIAVLISILLPALSSARAEGQKIKCMSTVRALGQTALTYSNDDPKGILGPVHPKIQQAPEHPSYDFGGGPGKPGVYDEIYVWEGIMDARTRPFNHIIYGPRGVTRNTEPGNRGVFQAYQCQGDDQGFQFLDPYPPEISEQSTFILTGSAYRQNNLVYTNMKSGAIYGRPINRIPDSAITLSYMESRAYQTLFYNDTWGQYPHQELDGYHRKRGYFNAAYCDGHAESRDFGKGAYFPEEPGYTFMGESGPETYGQLRGTFGRMDCYPEPPVKFIEDQMGGP